MTKAEFVSVFLSIWAIACLALPVDPTHKHNWMVPMLGLVLAVIAFVSFGFAVWASD